MFKTRQGGSDQNTATAKPSQDQGSDSRVTLRETAFCEPKDARIWKIKVERGTHEGGIDQSG